MIGNKSMTGKKHSEETRKKISQSLKGKTPKNLGISIAIKGKKLSAETRSKISKSNIGKKQTIVAREKMSKWRLGRFNGEKCHLWKGGVTPINQVIRTSHEYKLWRKAVFERDNYTCIWCVARSGNGKAVVLNADHIKPFALFPELRFAIDNGRTLCIECHRTTNTYGGKNKKLEDSDEA